MSAKKPRRSRAKTPSDALQQTKKTLASVRARLRDAEATLDAIRTGQVDALVVQGPVGDQVFTLKGTDRRYRQLVETMNEGALLVSPTGTIVYCNVRFAAMVDAPLERVMGSEIRQYVPEIWQRTLDAVLLGGSESSAHAEAEIVRRDGERMRVYLSSAESWDEAEKLVCLIVTDLAGQRRSQEAVASERLAGLIVEQAAEGVVVCDIEGRVVRASRAAEVVVEGNPLLRRFEEVFPLSTTEGAPMSADVIRSALRGETLTGVEAIVRRDLEESVLLLSAGPILSREGESLGCVVSFVDITDRKHAAEERALLLERATVARAESEAANRAKDEFLAMLGHELRNPLAPILTALQLMRMRGEKTAERERAVIERQINHLVTLVDDLLDVSRITRGRVELARKIVELSQVMAKAIELAAPMIEGRGHALHVEMALDLWVNADETRLAQVFSNLLTNAAKYTERGGHIWVRSFRRGDEVVVTVRDSGTGLAADLLPKIFELFVQGRRTIERSEGGLGLGLAIVRSLVGLHGGRVAARSEGLGRGSEFEIGLPAATPRSAEAAAASVLAPRDDAEQTTARRVLVVDDNEDAAHFLAEALEDFGHETRIAFDGPSALAEAARFHPEVALLDIGLPVMDGFELARRMRADVAPPKSVRLVALTGYGQSSDRQQSAAAGFDRHLVKPVQVEEVNRIIQQLTS